MGRPATFSEIRGQGQQIGRGPTDEYCGQPNTSSDKGKPAERRRRKATGLPPLLGIRSPGHRRRDVIGSESAALIRCGWRAFSRPRLDGARIEDEGTMMAATGTAHTARPAPPATRKPSRWSHLISALTDGVGRGHVTPTPTPDPDPCGPGSRFACGLRLSELASCRTSARTRSAGGATPPGRALGLQAAFPPPR